MMRRLLLIPCLAFLWAQGCAEFGDPNTRPFEANQQEAAPNIETPTDDPVEEPEEEPETTEIPTEEVIFEELPPQPYLPDTDVIEIALGVLVDGALLPIDPVVEPPESEVLNRPRRRMDIDQLDAAIERVSGGICWTDGTGDCENDDRLFVELSNSLGKPDYRTSTQEDLSPSALFQKFLGDASRFVCNQIMVRELNGEAPESILFQHASPTDTVESNPQGVDANLSALILRFHGRQIPVDSTRLELWRWLFQTSSYVANDPTLGWRNVCVALFSHPDFFTY